MGVSLSGDVPLLNAHRLGENSGHRCFVAKGATWHIGFFRARQVRGLEEQRCSRGTLPAHSAAPRSCTPRATPLALSRRSAARQPLDPAPRSFSTQLTKMAEELGDEDLVDYEEDEVVDDKPADEVKK